MSRTVEFTVETTDAFDADALLAEIGWVRSLALQLVRDVAAADDLVQETLLAALERRPREAGGLRPWLGAVLRRRASLARRGEARRLEREQREARTEALPSADELAARAQVQRLLVDAVLALSEPYRSTVLLRYFEGLAPQEIARRRGLADATVRSHLKRGVDELRATLDRRHRGDSRAWCLALIPLAAQRAGPKSAVASSLSAIVALLVMNTWFQVSVGAVALAALTLFLWPDHRAVAPAPAEMLALAPEPAPVQPSAESSLSEVASSERSQARVPESAPPVDRPRAFAGRVIDAKTRRPIEAYVLEVFDDSGAAERLETDREGRFTSSVPRVAGPVSMHLLDFAAPRDELLLNGSVLSRGEGVKRDVAWDGADDVDVEVSTGPTYRLRFALPRGLATSDFDASLSTQDARSADPAVPIFALRAPVRGVAAPFARFSGKMSNMRKEGSVWTLRLESHDGLWAGQTSVAPALGVVEDVAEIVLEPASSIRLEFVARDRSQLLEPLLQIERKTPARIDTRGESSFDGDPLSLTLTALDPGGYSLTFRARGMTPSVVELDLAPGVRIERTFVVERLASLAFVRGELRSRSGKYGDLVTVSLTGPSQRDRNLHVTWTERGGELVAPFAFEDLSPGRYLITLFSWDSKNRAWSPDSLFVEAPVEALEFVCDDVTPLQRIVFRVTDAATGELLANARVSASVGERPLLSADAFANGEQAFDVYEGVAMSWKVMAEGFVDAHGDASTFVASSGGLLQTVALERVR